MKMSFHKLVLAFVVVQSSASLFAGDSRDRSFDSDWRFLRADAPDAENPTFDDSTGALSMCRMTGASRICPLRMPPISRQQIALALLISARAAARAGAVRTLAMSSAARAGIASISR